MCDGFWRARVIPIFDKEGSSGISFLTRCDETLDLDPPPLDGVSDLTLPRAVTGSRPAMAGLHGSDTGEIGVGAAVWDASRCTP